MSGDEGLVQVSEVKCKAGDAGSGASDSLSAFACHTFSVALCRACVCFQNSPKETLHPSDVHVSYIF